MTPRVVQAPEPRVLGVLAGGDMDPDLLDLWAASADVLLAADAGLDRLLAIGREPHWVVGDFDSARRIDEVEEERRLHRPETDLTDCDKLLDLAAAHGYPSLTLAAVEGDQLDHVLAVLHSAVRSPLSVRLALRSGVGWLLRPGRELALPTAPGRRVSLLPLEDVGGAQLGDVAWPLFGEPLHPRARTSISNQTVGSVLRASIGSGSALLVLEVPREEIPIW